jgi:Rps23 Pro-64 3,4-dihydroxylase Tpa1-like proline 4-hydroxylase
VSGVLYFENVFPEDLCRFLLHDALETLRSGQECWRSNLQWHSGVVRASSPVLVRTYNDLVKKAVLDQLLKEKVIEHQEFVVMNYVWSKLGYIPWHNDESHETAVTVYLNDNWNENWGGIYLYRDSETGGIGGYTPKFNSAVRNDANTWHSTTIISSDAEIPRITLQLFSSKVGS